MSSRTLDVQSEVLCLASGNGSPDSKLELKFGGRLPWGRGSSSKGHCGLKSPEEGNVGLFEGVERMAVLLKLSK